MKRRDFIVAGGAALAWPFAAAAQEPGQTYRLGGLSVGPRTAPYWLGVFDELRQAGFVEGQNLIVDWRQYRAHADLIPQFAAELVKARVDVIAATGDTAIRAVQGPRQQFLSSAARTIWSDQD
jgi:putative tryptophan/tyrosine transport system substrate-binding protein